MNISKELKVGIVVIVSLGLFYYGFNYLKGANVFKSGTAYFAEYPNVNGLAPDDPIFIQGYRIGKVNGTYFNINSGKILVELLILNKEIVIPENSEAIIASSGLLGGKQINLKLGNSSTLLEEGDTISSGTEGDLIDSFTSSLEPFEKSAMEAVTSVDSVMKLVQAVLNKKNRKAIDESLANLSTTLSSLNSASAGLDELVSSEKKRLSLIISNLGTMSANLSAFSDTLNDLEIKQTIDEANLALSNANSILTKINEGEGTMGQLVNNDSLYMNLESASKNLDKLMVDFQENPKRYVHFSLFGKKDKKEEDGK